MPLAAFETWRESKERYDELRRLLTRDPNTRVSGKFEYSGLA
jgi:hypothetical protein